MDDFEITVSGSPPPRKPEGVLLRGLRRTARVTKAIMMRPRVVVATGLAAFVLFAGTPHVGWD